MMVTELSRARSVADIHDGAILAGVEIAAPPERVFRANLPARFRNETGAARRCRLFAGFERIAVGQRRSGHYLSAL